LKPAASNRIYGVNDSDVLTIISLSVNEGNVPHQATALTMKHGIKKEFKGTCHDEQLHSRPKIPTGYLFPDEWNSAPYMFTSVYCLSAPLLTSLV
jgi:hypothetical protein